MDWNDPAELLRLRDLLAEDPTQTATIEGPDGPVTDTVEMIVGRLGMPDVGGSYFTFSNENNDLIWGFLAECHRRGWIYRGHDTMPWCPRCGTGLSQMEMNEGYQDREDPGLTVRLPLLDRPGESLLVWTTTPWTLAANVAAAVGPDLRYVKVRQGEDLFWLSRGTLKQVLQGPFQVVEEAAGADLVGWRYAGPFDDLPAVRDAFAEAGYEHRVVAWGEVGEEEGTGIVHIAPGCGAEDFQLGHGRSGCRSSGRSTRTGATTRASAGSAAREAPAVTEAIIDDLERRRFFYHLEAYSHRYPHCWRCGTPLLFRLVDEWYISMGEVYDQPRETLTKAQVDASLRYQIMEVVDRIRWIPSFGYERELDWLLNMRDWMISKKRYYGLALPIYDCRDVRRRSTSSAAARSSSGARSRAGTQFEGHTPHRPCVDAVKIACPSCGEPVARIPDVGNPWLDAGIVPFSTLHYREDPDVLGEVVPGRLHHRELPGPVPQLVLRDARDVHGAPARGAVQDDLRLRHAVRRGRAADAQVLGQRDRVRRGRRADGRRRHALDVRVVAARGQHPVRLARGRRGAARAARPVERLRVLRHLRAPGRAGRPRRGRRRVAERSALDRWILSRSAAVAAEVEARPARLRRPGGDAASSTPTSTTCPRGTCGCRGDGCRAGAGADRDAAFATLHAALVALARTVAPILPFLGETMYRNLVAGDGSRRARQRPPDAVAGRRAGAPARRAARGGGGRRPARRRPVPDAARPGRPQGPPAARPTVARAPRRDARGARRAARADPRRGQRQGRRADRRRIGARRSRRQGAAAEGGQAPRREDPGRDGGGARGPVRDPPGRLGDDRGRDARARRGRGPGDAAARHRRRPR